MPISISNKVYERVSFSKEQDFESVIVQLADHMFGEKSIYLDLKKKIKGFNIGGIPDGYLIDMTYSDEPKLYVIENEIVSHDPFRHIGIQMLKFVTSFEEERMKIRNFIMDEISKDKLKLARLENGCDESNSRNIDNYLDKAVFNEFHGLVIIDEARQELFKVLEKINSDISVLEVKTYRSADKEYAYEYDTLYEIEEETLPAIDLKKDKQVIDPKVRRQRRAECDTIVVPAHEEGFNRVFLGENAWYAIRVSAAMKNRIKYIAAYQVAPISAVTHVAEISDIKPYKDTGKYIVYFKGEAQKIKQKKLRDPNKSPQGHVYVKYTDLTKNEYLDDSIVY